MAGIGDILFNMMGPDPEQALGQWSDAQQAGTVRIWDGEKESLGEPIEELDDNDQPLPRTTPARGGTGSFKPRHGPGARSGETGASGRGVKPRARPSCARDGRRSCVAAPSMTPVV